MSGGLAQERLARLKERFAAVSLEPVAPDASTRRFFRLRRQEGGSAILLVDEAGGAGALRRMVAAHEVLAGAGVRLPALLDSDQPLCALLYEDLGDRLLADALGSLSAEQRRETYREAGRMAGRIARIDVAPITGDHPLAFPRLSEERLRTELAFFAVHEVTGRKGVDDPRALRRLARGLDEIARRASLAQPRLAHRDFHARNLMLLADSVLAAVDFQDALLAPAFYDLVSLIYDPYVELTPQERSAAREGFESETGDRADLENSETLAWTAVQRLLKAIGTYAFQSTQLERRYFERYIPVAATRALELLHGLGGEAAREVVAMLEDLGLTDPRPPERRESG